MSARSRLAVVVGLMLVVVACGGGSSATTQQPSGSTTTTSTGAGTTSPTPTQPPPSGEGGDGEVMMEIEGTRYDLSVRKDIPFAALPSQNFPTRCEPSFGGRFWVIAVGVDDQGVQHPNLALQFGLFPDGTADEDFGIVVPAEDEFDDRLEYDLDEENPGSWTIEGNRIHGELNVHAGDRQTTAQFDVTCPG